jgi:hypothetical protein
MFTHESQASQLAEHIHLYRGWPHPDGVRWILPVESPSSTRQRLIASGWPEDAVAIAF